MAAPKSYDLSPDGPGANFGRTRQWTITLNFCAAGNARIFLLDGWSNQEADLIWSLGPRSSLEVGNVHLGEDLRLSLDVAPCVRSPSVVTGRLRVVVGNWVVGSFRLRRRSVVECRIPAHLILPEGRLKIDFQHPDFIRPSDFGGADKRQLAFAFHEVTLSVVRLRAVSTTFLKGGQAGLWVEAKKSSLLKSISEPREAGHQLVNAARNSLATGSELEIGNLLREYVTGAGSYSDPTRWELRGIIDEAGRRQGFLEPRGSFFDAYWQAKADAVRRFCPDAGTLLFEIRSNAALERHDILEPSPNELLGARIPRPLGNATLRKTRPGFRAYSTDDALVYIHPFQYQIMTKDKTAAWASGSPRALSRRSIPALVAEEVSGNIVVLQDRFEFTNLCHFVYDGISRMLHYVENFGVAKNDLFVFGGIPSDYHELVCAAVTETLGVEFKNLFFPAEAHILSTRRKCFWFSDQFEDYIHPAQMAHPRAISAIAKLFKAIPSDGSAARKLYVSRGDSGIRRISNEAALTEVLEREGFTVAQLGKISATKQIGLFRGAEAIVAPHGMGLTHIIAATDDGGRLGRVVELFHPSKGTDAYALVCRALGVDYDFLIGTALPDGRLDFEIDLDRFMDTLVPLRSPPIRPSWPKNANLILSSRTLSGLVAASEASVEPHPVEMNWGQRALWHQCSAGAGDLAISPRMQIAAGRKYTASCWILIPADFTGSLVRIRIDNAMNLLFCDADLTKKGQWQRIWSTATVVDAGVAFCVLEITASIGSGIASTCWQFERGSTPTAYVSTD